MLTHSCFGVTYRQTQRNAIAVIMSVAYGYQVADEDDRFVGLLEESFRLTGLLNEPGRYLVEFLPFCEPSSIT